LPKTNCFLFNTLKNMGIYGYGRPTKYVSIAVEKTHYIMVEEQVSAKSV
jgi:hypothetical protein